MRPSILLSLFAPLTSLPGVGPMVLKRLEKMLGSGQVIDLLTHIPRQVVTRHHYDLVNDLPIGEVASFTGKVIEHQPSPAKHYGGKPKFGGGQRPYRILLSDKRDDGLVLVYFHADSAFLNKLFPIGEERIVSGKIEVFGELKQMPHPDYVEPIERAKNIPQLEPIYGLTMGISNRQVGRMVEHCLNHLLPELPEWCDPKWLKAPYAWPSFGNGLRMLHRPESIPQMQPNPENLELFDPASLSNLKHHDHSEVLQNIMLSPAAMRLAYDELLANQLALALVRKRLKKDKGRSQKGDGFYRSQVLAKLPFQLTQSQNKVLAEIFADMEADERMVRLLQGDVGSGKTIIALMAMLNALEAGRLAGAELNPDLSKVQAALIAPTEILAKQHFDVIAPMVEALGIKITLLTGRGRLSAKERRSALEGISSGEIQIIIGTHALFQEEVSYHDLAIIIIDEQHRFGVHQRLGLSAKGKSPDMLVMTATPIPRTLMLSAYGDLDHSRLTEKPPGRKPIKTVVIPNQRLPDVVERLCNRLAAGDQAFWICPLVEENEEINLISAQERVESLLKVIPQQLGEDWHDKIGLVHGRMKGAEKDAIMSRFQQGEIRLLVATTVVEVGVDVPNACIMIIEHAEHFGLSQLHQLRGRVGRGEKPSSCLLLRADHIGQNAFERLKIIASSEDGLMIAEKDLELRGAGEVLGVRQSGLPEFKFADIALHGDLMKMARQDAIDLLKSDPMLETPRGSALKLLLYLFRYDTAMSYIESG